jgi:hypothetical protein
VLRTSQLRDYDQVMERIRQGRQAGLTAAQIAGQLNAEGFKPAAGQGAFTKNIVHALAARLGATKPRRHREKLPAHEWWLRDLVLTLRTSESQLRHWIEKGWIHARALPWKGTHKRYWVVWADRDEVRRLRRLHASQSGRCFETYPPELTTPKDPPASWNEPNRVLGADRSSPSRS